MVEINRQICLDKSDASKIEQKYIENLQSNMNSQNQYFSIDIPVSVTSTYENEYDEDEDDDL